MANTFSFNAADVRSAAGNIRSNAANIDAAIKAVVSEGENIKNNWKGLDSLAYIARLNSTANKATKEVTAINDLADRLEQLAKIIEITEAQNAEGIKGDGIV